MKGPPKIAAGTIIADPPWVFKNQASRGAAANHYACMSHEALLALRPAVADQAHLYLWTTGGHLVDGSAGAVMRAWGFAPKYLLTWVKTTDLLSVIEQGKVKHRVASENGFDAKPSIKIAFGLGNWFRRNAEFVVFGVRGKLPAAVKNLPDTFFAPRLEHSRKPEFVHELAERMSPGPRVELFARRARKGWTAWGDQL